MYILYILILLIIIIIINIVVVVVVVVVVSQQNGSFKEFLSPLPFFTGVKRVDPNIFYVFLVIPKIFKIDSAPRTLLLWAHQSNYTF